MHLQIVAPYQLWHTEGDVAVADLSFRLATLVNENLTHEDSILTITNLKSNTLYTFFLIPEGVGTSETHKICRIVNTTLPETSSCYIDIQPSWIFDESNNNFPNLGITPYTLFDEQEYGDSICLPTSTKPKHYLGY